MRKSGEAVEEGEVTKEVGVLNALGSNVPWLADPVTEVVELYACEIIPRKIQIIVEVHQQRIVKVNWFKKESRMVKATPVALYALSENFHRSAIQVRVMGQVSWYCKTVRVGCTSPEERRFYQKRLLDVFCSLCVLRLTTPYRWFPVNPEMSTITETSSERTKEEHRGSL